MEESTASDNVSTISKPKSEMFQCKICPYNTLRKPFLDKHTEQKHGFAKVKPDVPNKKRNARSKVQSSSKRKRTDSSGDSESNNRGDTKFVCKLCDFTTNNNVSLNIHLATHETGEGEMYQCTQCEFQTVKVSALRTHAFTHKKLELHTCPNCDYATRHKCNFNAHLKTHEDPASLKIYGCEFCNSFNSYHKSSLNKHIISQHKDAKQLFQCEQCSYATPNRAHLRTHSKVHIDPADLPTYHCEICDFETHNEVTIRRHVNKHKERNEKGEELIVKEIDGITKTVWFCCDMCQFRTKDQRYVLLHKRVHARADEINRMGEEIVFGMKKVDEETDNSLKTDDSS